MSTHCGCALGANGVEDADGVGLVGQIGDLACSDPAESGCLLSRDYVTAGDLGTEHESDDSAGHVLVDAGERAIGSISSPVSSWTSRRRPSSMASPSSSTRAAMIYQHATKDRCKAIKNALGGLMHQVQSDRADQAGEGI